MKPKSPRKKDPKPKEVTGKVSEVDEYKGDGLMKAIKDGKVKLTVTPFNGTIYRAAMNFDEDIFLYGFCARDENGNWIDPRTIRMKKDGSYVIIK